MHKLFSNFAFFVIVLTTVSCNSDQEETTPQFSLHEPTITAVEDYSIYSLIINQWSGNYYIVNQRSFYFNALSEDEMTNLLQENNPTYDSSLSQILIDNNTTTGFLGNFFNCDPKVIRLTTPEEMDYIFQDDNPDIGWQKFYSYFNYPDGLFSFSKIAYNEEGTKALVDCGFAIGFLAGEGYLVYLEKENNTWVIQEIRSTWVSKTLKSNTLKTHTLNP